MNKQKEEYISSRLMEQLSKTVDLLPTWIRSEALAKMYIAGGAIASLIRGEEPNDYDVFFRDESIMKRVTFMFQDEDDTLGRHVEITTGNAIKLMNGSHLVRCQWGEAENLVETFDFAHTHGYYSFLGGLVIPEYTLTSCKDNILIYVGRHNPVSSLERITKFVVRGWTVNRGEYAKILSRIVADTDWTNFSDVHELFHSYDSNDGENETIASHVFYYVGKRDTDNELFTAINSASGYKYGLYPVPQEQMSNEMSDVAF
jgi:hypothetical protein